jgi:hypothetical protein
MTTHTDNFNFEPISMCKKRLDLRQGILCAQTRFYTTLKSNLHDSTANRKG